MDVTLVTSNPGKHREIEAILAPYGVRVRALSRTLVEPQAERLETVVDAKLDQLSSLRGFVIVEDSGLFIDALGGFPGVYSAYVLQTLGLPDLLRLLEGKPRAATFRTVAGLRRGKRHWLFPGEVRGTIAQRPRGRGGFGYDPVFVPSGARSTYAQASVAQKNESSHRAISFRALGMFLSRQSPRL
ncbi:MAG: non-canonical purine NTP pyrophosphatase [Thermoplasmata archaeon]|nr:non-canonical purine NTP pyrophosphatase [Thermoplasmata archaeon]